MFLLGKLKNRVRISVTVTPDLLAKLDKYAAEKSINRNAAVNAAIATVIEQSQAINLMPDLLKAYAELKNKDEQ